MKEKLYTIPLNDAIAAGDECPFCYIERELEQDLLDFALGSSASYMESDVRDATDRAGFCRTHYKKMFDYGNTLGNAWIMKTYLLRQNRELNEKMKQFTPGKNSSTLFKPRKDAYKANSISGWIDEKEHSCYICNQFNDMYNRAMDTFLNLYQKDDGFHSAVNSSKGFCMTHFGDLCEYAQTHLSVKEQSDFYPPIFDLMRKNMDRVFEDVSWLIEKFDYRNKDADWKQSKDAVQRSMQKCKGGYPADPPHKSKK